jgi:hypothetical protein
MAKRFERFDQRKPAEALAGEMAVGDLPLHFRAGPGLVDLHVQAQGHTIVVHMTLQAAQIVLETFKEALKEAAS